MRLNVTNDVRTKFRSVVSFSSSFFDTKERGHVYKTLVFMIYATKYIVCYIHKIYNKKPSHLGEGFRV